MPIPTDTTTRRGMVLAATGLAVTGLAALGSTAQAAPRHLKMADLKKEADVACVYHCDFGDPARFAQMLTNISNHFSAYGGDSFALEIVVVAHGPGIKFFLSNLDDTPWREEVAVPKLFDRVVDVAKSGLKVHLCEITFERQKVDMAKARDAAFITFVPSGVATVGALQAKGFGYIKIG